MRIVKSPAIIALTIFLGTSCVAHKYARASESHERIIVDNASLVTPPSQELNGFEMNLWAANSGTSFRPDRRRFCL